MARNRIDVDGSGWAFPLQGINADGADVCRRCGAPETDGKTCPCPVDRRQPGNEPFAYIIAQSGLGRREADLKPQGQALVDFLDAYQKLLDFHRPFRRRGAR